MRTPQELIRPPWLRYGVAAVAAAAALAATRAFWPVFQAVPFMLGFVAVFAVGWFAGGGAGFLATILVAAGTLLILPISGPGRSLGGDDLLRLLLFLGAGGFISLMQRQLVTHRRTLLDLREESRRSRETVEAATIDLGRYQAIVESSDDAIIGKNLDGTVTAWNAAAQRLLGYTADEMIGTPISRLMPESNKHDMTDILTRIARGERVEHFETVRLHKAGHPVWVSLSVSPVKDASGRIVGAAKIARDISERRRLEFERERLLDEANRAVETRDAFLSVAGHEFRTPLSALNLTFFNWALRARAENDTRSLERIAKGQQQVDRLTRLTEDLLDIGRISAGRLELQRAPSDLTALVRDVAGRLDESAARSGSRLEIEAAGPVVGQWDRSRLDQVVTNLLTNAVKFGPGKPIVVTVHHDDGMAELTVSDRGIGINSVDQERIFERFERAVSERSYTGIGLGLWITRQLVTAHGGTISVESEPGHGATFRVRLPALGG